MADPSPGPVYWCTVTGHAPPSRQTAWSLEPPLAERWVMSADPARPGICLGCCDINNNLCTDKFKFANHPHVNENRHVVLFDLLLIN